jgi:hypothetical protein
MTLSIDGGGWTGCPEFACVAAGEDGARTFEIGSQAARRGKDRRRCGPARSREHHRTAGWRSVGRGQRRQARPIAADVAPARFCLWPG